MMKGEKMMKRSSFGGIRKRLSDITNLHSQIKSPAKEKENTPIFDGSSTKNYIDQLLKDNAAMMKLIQEKDKVIESTGMEMQKLRVLVQKAQLQNFQLAQSNSQMLAELNMGKDRLKVLRHELACKDAWFKARIVELEGKVPMQCQTNELQENTIMQCETNDLQVICGLPVREREIKPKKEPAIHPLQDNNKSKVAKNKKRRPSRSRSLGSTTSQQTADKEMAENKRRCLRRQSVRLKQEQENQIDLFEIDVANFPMSPQPMNNASHNKSNSDVASMEKGRQESPNDSGSQRSSIGRPLRRAVGKVQSYKEPSLTTKMRRPD